MPGDNAKPGEEHEEPDDQEQEEQEEPKPKPKPRPVVRRIPARDDVDADLAEHEARLRRLERAPRDEERSGGGSGWLGVLWAIIGAVVVAVIFLLVGGSDDGDGEQHEPDPRPGQRF